MTDVAKATDTVLLLTVLAILVVVLGAAESGVGPSASAPGPSPPVIHRTTQVSRTSSITRTTVKPTTVHRTTRTTTPETSTSETTSTSMGTATAESTLQAAVWYVLVPTVICLAGGMVSLLLRKEKPKIFDLKSVVKDMESQRDYFAGSLSKRLRNAALLRYYVLMAQACAKLGIIDEPADTPHEFIGRASLKLDVGAVDAERFADVVDRAHYGAELTEEEVSSASAFMDSFTKVIVGKSALG